MYYLFGARGWPNESFLEIHERTVGTVIAMITEEQLDVCNRYGVVPFDAPPALKAGVASNVKSTIVPLNGLRHPPEGNTSGWYLWAGEELTSDPNAFLPVHIEHLSEWRPEVLKYLALPPGWRFLVAGDYEDVWFDASLLNV